MRLQVFKQDEGALQDGALFIGAEIALFDEGFDTDFETQQAAVVVLVEALDERVGLLGHQRLVVQLEGGVNGLYQPGIMPGCIRIAVGDDLEHDLRQLLDLYHDEISS